MARLKFKRDSCDGAITYVMQGRLCVGTTHNWTGLIEFQGVGPSYRYTIEDLREIAAFMEEVKR